MIDPQHQWAIQIDVTNACTRSCSNCTRFVGHFAEPFFMTPEQYAVAVDALIDFPADSPTHAGIEHKLIGMIGGEPLLHPEFEELAAITESMIPNRENRGLWTGVAWRRSEYAALIERVFSNDGIHNNQHDSECIHSPILVALFDVIPDEDGQREALISGCWLQRKWASTITPKGFFFCEVAGAMDMLFDGPGGLLVEPGCWSRPLADFQEQIDRWCGRCGIPLNLMGRLDREGVDDISVRNLLPLKDSPRIKNGRYVLWDGAKQETTEAPWEYRR